MPPKNSAKKSKRAFDVKVLNRHLVDYDKDSLLEVVDSVCRMNVAKPGDLEAAAKALTLRAYQVEMYDRKPLAVLARRLHDRMPRFDGHADGAQSQDRVTLASCVARVCDQALADVHTKIQDDVGSCSMESSLSGVANDENQQPMGSEDRPCRLDEAAVQSDEPPSEDKAPTLLQQLHALQTFSACLYTQDLVSEVFIHNIIDHVRYGSASWPASAREAAICGVCDMTKFCGKRLESLGSLKLAMPDLYRHLEQICAQPSTSGKVKAAIAETLALRNNDWEAPKDGAADSPDAPAAAVKAEEKPFGFAEMLGASGVTVSACEPLPAPGRSVAAGTFLGLDAHDHAVKDEDMLAAVQGIDI